MIRAAIFALAFALTSTHAQQSAPKRVGFFSVASAAANAPRIGAFREGMTELGWVDGKDYIVDARYGEATGTNSARLAADVVASRPDVILTTSNDAIHALLNATTTVPIVFATALDPLAFERVKSMQRPGGNATGLASLRGELGAKSVQFIKEAFPGVSHVAVLVASGDVGAARSGQSMVEAAQQLGMRSTKVDVNGAEDIAPAVARASAAGCHAYVVADGFLFASQRTRLTTAINRSRLPAIYGRTEYAEAGGLMSYSGSTHDSFRRAASYVDKILKGARPGDLPIEQPTKFELTVNMKTAKASGIKIPTSLLVRADKVIQ